MHQLYTFPMACSVVVQMVLEQHGVPYEARDVARGPARKVGTEGFEAVNAKRKVPTLVLPDGEVLTEIVSILHTLDATWAPVAPAQQRRRLEWLAYVATELHQPILGPLFDPDAPPAVVEDATERMLPPLLAHLEAFLVDRETLLGGPPCSADAYLLWAIVLLGARRRTWVRTPGLDAYRRRMLAHPFVAGPLAADQQRLTRP
ncbi:MAG: glutathione S-transferase N-terminal domain-containing protein [Myxococcota bacterium]